MKLAKLSFFREPRLVPDDELAVLVSQGLAVEIPEEVPNGSSQAALNGQPSKGQDTDQGQEQGSVHKAGKGEGDGRASLCPQGHVRA
jgi:hypothetical protein